MWIFIEPKSCSRHNKITDEQPIFRLFLSTMWPLRHPWHAMSHGLLLLLLLVMMMVWHVLVMSRAVMMVWCVLLSRLLVLLRHNRHGRRTELGRSTGELVSLVAVLVVGLVVWLNVDIALLVLQLILWNLVLVLYHIILV